MRAEAPPDLPEEPAQAARHLRARTARASSLLEDYVELIDDLLVTGGEARAADIARRLGVSHATVSNTISRLKLAGLVHSKPYRGVFLTEAGMALAQTVRTRHRVVVDVLVAIGVPDDVAETDAEGIEHHVSGPTLKAFEAFLRGLRPDSG
ncbi:manganese-binding transcriptional regulator MntR [Roseococcus sp. SYP-B2431]|nr:manganese-binding transcriptional regulator MntR [Roseococcus sp. SYP-B2431]